MYNKQYCKTLGFQSYRLVPQLRSSVSKKQTTPPHHRTVVAWLPHCSGKLPHCSGMIPHCSGMLPHCSSRLPHCSGILPHCSGIATALQRHGYRTVVARLGWQGRSAQAVVSGPIDAAAQALMPAMLPRTRDTRTETTAPCALLNKTRLNTHTIKSTRLNCQSRQRQRQPERMGRL